MGSAAGGTAIGHSWHVGTVAGVAIRVHATMLLLIAWVLVAQIVQGGGLKQMVVAAALLVAVFAIVVAHELGHALAARRYQIRTRAITLLPIGGIAEVDRMPERPGQELVVALAGPAVNVALAAMLFALCQALRAPTIPSGPSLGEGGFLAQLLWINVSLAVFNLIPAFPMDGGRVLRAALSFRLDAVRATAIAAAVGQGFAIVFGLVGLAINPVLALIAVFIWFGARAESTSTRVKAALAGVTAAHAMLTSYETLRSDQPLRIAAERVLASEQHSFPVVEDDVLVGLLTRDDLIRGLVTAGPEAPIASALRREVTTIASSDRLDLWIDRLDGIDAAVVTDEGHPVGLLTAENVGELLLVRQAMAAHRDGIAAR